MENKSPEQVKEYLENNKPKGKIHGKLIEFFNKDRWMKYLIADSMVESNQKKIKLIKKEFKIS